MQVGSNDFARLEVGIDRPDTEKTIPLSKVGVIVSNLDGLSGIGHIDDAHPFSVVSHVEVIAADVTVMDAGQGVHDIVGHLRNVKWIAHVEDTRPPAPE